MTRNLSMGIVARLDAGRKGDDHPLSQHHHRRIVGYRALRLGLGMGMRGEYENYAFIVLTLLI